MPDTSEAPTGPYLAASPEDKYAHGTKDTKKTGCGKRVGAAVKTLRFDPDGKNACPACRRLYR